ILINGHDNTVGGTDPNARNIIAFNGGGTPMCTAFLAGIWVHNAPAINNAILGNSIFSNAGLGIDLEFDGDPNCVEPNVHCNPGPGPNDLQNYPVITSATCSGGSVMLSGTLDSVASTMFRIEFFSSPACNPTGFGEGKHFLGSANVTTNGSCTANFGPLSFPFPFGDTIATATATRLGPLAGWVTPPANMVSGWPGDGNANDIQDGNNGTLQGGATFAPGEVRQAFSFTANTNSGVLVPSSASLNPTEAITIDAWVNPSSYPNTAPAVVRKDVNQVGTTQYSLNIGDGGTAGGVNCNIGGTVGATGGSVPLNQWTHVACTYDRQNLRAYVNGTQVASTAATQAIPVGSQNLGIGQDPGFTDRNFDGLIDEVEIFNRALSQAEIQSIVNAGNAGKCKPCVTPPPNMVSWWPGDGNANDIQDGNNGTLQGGATFAPGEVRQAF